MDREYPRISFKNRIKSVKDEAEKIGRMVIESNRKTITLLNKYDEKIAKEVIATSKDIDEATFDLERMCIRFLAAEQPLAGDLMFIESTIRITSHIKRIATLAANIAEVSALIKDVNVPDKLKEDLQYMADYVQMMLSKGIYTFLDQNVEMAKELRRDDDKVDDLFDTILEQVTDCMFKDKEAITQIINIVFIARFLERIGDRAVDIGQRTIFMLTLKKPKR
ncbi:MAG: phosphate signaling complex protein PhoU [Methanobacteriaceae archaeon]|nr:phosphate signaling complex protein PhoU [Candidatus Methanorudis spinitermitis]